MSSKNWRNAIIILLLLAGLVFVVDVIMKFFLTEQNLPNSPDLVAVRDSLTGIFNIVTFFTLALAVILFPVWVYKRLRERRGNSTEIREGNDRRKYMEYEVEEKE